MSILAGKLVHNDVYVDSLVVVDGGYVQSFVNEHVAKWIYEN